MGRRSREKRRQRELRNALDAGLKRTSIGTVTFHVPGVGPCKAERSVALAMRAHPERSRYAGD